MQSHDSRRMALPLACRVGDDADAAQIAQAVAAIWQEIEATLTPILGQHGVAALYKRSLHLTAGSYPWLAAKQDHADLELNVAALRSVLAARTAADAAAGGSALLEAFHGLLASLVGPSLTERLLRSVWAQTSSGSSAQDTLP